MRYLILLLIGTISFAQAEFPKIENHWLQAAPPSANVMAAYGELINNSNQDMALVDVYSPAFNMSMIHQSIVVDGVAKMIHQDELIIKSHDKLTFKPGSYHIMLMQPKFKISEGEQIKINLIYKQKDTRVVQEIWFPVEFR